MERSGRGSAAAPMTPRETAARLAGLPAKSHKEDRGSRGEAGGCDDQVSAFRSMKRTVVRVVTERRFREDPALPSRQPRLELHRSRTLRRTVGTRKVLNKNGTVARSDRHVKAIILQKETLSGVSCREGQPQAIAAVDVNSRRMEAVTIGLDMDVAVRGATLGATAVINGGSTAPVSRTRSAAYRYGLHPSRRHSRCCG